MAESMRAGGAAGAAQPVETMDSESLSAQVYRRLRTALMRAELLPEQRLKIRELSLRFGVSETPVREALFQLAREGALELKPRHFIKVRRLSLSEFMEIRDIRLQLEPLAAERALPHIRKADIDELARAHAALAAAEAACDYPAAVQRNFDFHFGLYWRSSMPMLIDVLETLWIRMGPLFSELYPDGHPRYVDRHQHENVLDALRRRDGYALREAIRQDLLEGGRNFVKHLERVERKGE